MDDPDITLPNLPLAKLPAIPLSSYQSSYELDELLEDALDRLAVMLLSELLELDAELAELALMETLEPEEAEAELVLVDVLLDELLELLELDAELESVSSPTSASLNVAAVVDAGF